MARVLLISTYELGHQPVHVASPAQALRSRGHEVRAVDLAVQPWRPVHVDDVDVVAISVPMHTAARLALDLARAIRARRPGLPICLYGLYAEAARPHLAGGLVDRVLAGEYEPGLCAWVDGRPDPPGGPRARGHRLLPARDLLPPLARYARLLAGGEERLAAAVQTSHGCASRCRHCPVPAVYDGRTRIVDAGTVLADIDQVVALGAAHLTFADPDFLNGPHHSLRVVRAMHRRHPAVTFDLTTKVELILRHRRLWPELAASGCVFVTTAVECVDDTILGLLDKGHTARDAAEAVTVLGRAGIPVRPSLLPFTPWTTMTGLADLVDFVVGHDLVDNVDPVQWAIRLLIPAGSLLLARPELTPYLDGYDEERLGWRWHAADPRLDELQAALAVVVEDGLAAGAPTGDLFARVAGRITAATGRRFRIPSARAGPGRPRLSEPWFCCAEPTARQRDQVPRSAACEAPGQPTPGRCAPGGVRPA